MSCVSNKQTKKNHLVNGHGVSLYIDTHSMISVFVFHYLDARRFLVSSVVAQFTKGCRRMMHMALPDTGVGHMHIIRVLKVQACQE